jgi:two-component system phosphate regulon sensor histidine kinase PhoR
MKLFNLLFLIALICLFSLQAIWLCNTYQSCCRNIKESINSIFNLTIEKELDQRFLELWKKIMENLPEANDNTASFKYNYSVSGNEMENENLVSQQFTLAQQLMATCHIRFDLLGFEKIFQSLLESNHYSLLYQINYADSAGRIISTTGEIIDKGFKTAVFPVVDGEYVYAIVKITAPVVFKKMLVILIISILILFLIITCLVCEIKLFINQFHINQFRSNFAHALIHDAKTPLATIYSVLVQLKNGDLNKNPDMRQKFNVIAIEQVHNLQTTVNQILTLIYAERKQLSLNKQVIDLPAMTQSLIDKFTVKFDKNIVFLTSYDLKSNRVYADPFYLGNIISNLIDNAIKYSGDSVKIEIECTADERQIYISVKDNGFGISSKNQTKIFKRFERVVEMKRKHISGFGIGLNYVQRVIEAHGGTVTVTSKEGTGSEFVITLPVQ